MIQEIQQLLDQYLKWLKDKSTIRQIDGKWVEITTPFLDRHNDYLQIYAKIEKDGTVLLSDDGYVMTDLNVAGFDFTSKKRLDLLQITLNGFGVRQEGDALVVRSSKDRFPIQKHNLVQAMLAINDMFYLSEASVASLFLEDVTRWLDISDIRYTPRIKFTGRTGYDHLFDFVIPKSKTRPERILRAINKPNRENAQLLAFAWMDTREVRPEDSKAYAIINDSERSITPSVSDALKSYSIIPVAWSQRDAIRAELAA
jgi:hypothetical protein